MDPQGHINFLLARFAGQIDFSCSHADAETASREAVSAPQWTQKTPKVLEKSPAGERHPRVWFSYSESMEGKLSAGTKSAEGLGLDEVWPVGKLWFDTIATGGKGNGNG